MQTGEWKDMVKAFLKDYMDAFSASDGMKYSRSSSDSPTAITAMDAAVGSTRTWKSCRSAPETILQLRRSR